ncbi:MAG: hypothetical protein P1U58_17975 [Verrucomicrobiales bacterium]|nr:hypothetical protein [Verrucomicrobiales bacterium]
MLALDEGEFAATFGSKMIAVEGDPPFDFWPYVDSIPISDYQGFDCSECRITNVWRSDDGLFEHVMIRAKEDENVFMVIVLAPQKKVVVGHRLLNLNKEYGLE